MVRVGIWAAGHFIKGGVYPEACKEGEAEVISLALDEGFDLLELGKLEWEEVRD